MDDPWDVKSVRHSGQYTSCMKLNGAPLLPPVLSKECRKEMQYYKLLAKEVEKRISILQPYVASSDTESNEDKTDAPEIPESEQNYDLGRDNVEAAFDLSIDKATALAKQNNKDTELPISDNYEICSPNIVTTTDAASSKFVIDFSLSINQTGRNVLETVKRKSPCPCPAIELPERDYNCVRKRELLLDLETNTRTEPKKEKAIEDLVNFSISLNKNELTDPFLGSISSQDRPPSMNSKSFTGSLNDLHTESVKGAPTKLSRQRSYTLLNPSPQLLAHLEVQSLNTGIEMSCISMSESLSNLSFPNKKRRSWDLESAKVKWSSMALELKTKKLPSSTNTNSNKNIVKPTKKSLQAIYTPSKTKSVVSEKNRRASTPSKPTPKSEPLQKRRPSPVRNIPSNVTIVKGPASPKIANQKKEPLSPKSPPLKSLIFEPEDPAIKVRELYDKIQKQQLVQMASLVEKQKREQMMLQQVFEEQNTLLFKQLKTIVPKSPVEAKEAWGEKSLEADRGPVSLSQLINHKSPDQSDSTALYTLTDTNKYIDKCDDVLKKSRDLSESLKKPKTANQNGTNVQRAQPEGSRTRTHSPVRNKSASSSVQRNASVLSPVQKNTVSSPVQKNTSVSSPVQRNTSRRLNYDTSSSYDPILTDRTNDTMADLNVTFPTDISDDCEPYSHNNTAFNNCGKEVTVIHASPCPSSNPILYTSTDSAINCMERTIQNSINSSCARRPKSNTHYQQPTSRQLAAAAKIVAFAKGWLVRRLMRTERVTATVQTIRDALLCALQLHQDREGIRGADVDLHRRLIQQITAACYSLHDTFITSSPAERCAMLAADRARRRSLANRPHVKPTRHSDIMSQSHSGVFPARPKRHSTTSLMTQSTYESYSSEKCRRARYMPSPRHRPWR